MKPRSAQRVGNKKVFNFLIILRKNKEGII